MLSHLGQLAQEKEGRQVVLEFQPTARNEPAKKFLEEHCLLPAGGLGGAQLFPADKVPANPNPNPNPSLTLTLTRTRTRTRTLPRWRRPS